MAQAEDGGTIRELVRWLGTRPSGAYLVAASVALAVITVYVGAQRPPNLLAASILQAVAFVLGIYGSHLFSRSTQGKVDPALADAAERQLTMIAVRANEARSLAEQAFESESGPALRTTTGKLSVHLSYIEDMAANEVQNWRSVRAVLPGPVATNIESVEAVG